VLRRDLWHWRRCGGSESLCNLCPLWLKVRILSCDCNVHTRFTHSKMFAHTPRVVSFGVRLAFCIVALLFTCSAEPSQAMPADVVTTIYFGGTPSPAIEYQLRRRGGKQVSFKLLYEHKLIGSGTFEYPDGYSGLISDLINGFGEASVKIPIENSNTNGNDTYLEFRYGTKKTHSEMKFRGSIKAYLRFVGGSPKLARALRTMSQNRNLAYRIWSD